MSESKPVQYIPITYPFIDSVLFDDLDGRVLKLYFKMRRYVCRSRNHRLGGYYERGYLATEGFLGTWAEIFKTSKATVSRYLSDLESRKIIYCDFKSLGAGSPNIYILGRVLFVPGSTQTREFFYLDFLGEAEQESGGQFEPDSTGLDYILPSDVSFTDTLKITSEMTTVSNLKRSVSKLERSVSPVKPSNIESNKESNNNLETPETDQTPVIDLNRILHPFDGWNDDLPGDDQIDSDGGAVTPYQKLLTAFISASHLPLLGDIKPRDNEALVRMVAAGVTAEDIEQTVTWFTKNKMFITGPASIENGATITAAKRIRETEKTETSETKTVWREEHF